MDLDSGIESGNDYLARSNEPPSISFSPNRCRFSRQSKRDSLQNIEFDVLEESAPATLPIENMTNFDKSLTSFEDTSNSNQKPVHMHHSIIQEHTELQSRLEKKISRANSFKANPSPQHPRHHYDDTTDNSNVIVVNSETHTSDCENLIVRINSKSGVSLTGFSAHGAKKVPTLIPQQRLAIPVKGSAAGGASSVSGSGKPENKPLVQWDSEESEEEYFFPTSKAKTMTESQNIDNLNLSEEDDDLHLSPPQSTSHCPCDPRQLKDYKFRRDKHCVIL